MTRRPLNWMPMSWMPMSWMPMSWMLVILAASPFLPAAGVQESNDRTAQKELELLSVRKIWDRAPHNAFTDLIRFQNRWICVFREGARHVSPDGALRVITSADGSEWESAALIESPDSDLRDAKITVTPDGHLMLAGAEAFNQPGPHTHQSLVWFSENGHDWSSPRAVGEPDNWLWRIDWFRDRAYGFGYGCGKDNRGLTLFSSEDGKQFDVLVKDVDLAGTYPNETSLVFTDRGTGYCLLRQDGVPKNGFLGRAEAPFTHWTWQELDKRIGGPKLLQLPTGELLAAVRLYDGQVRTSLCWVDPADGRLVEALKLPSGGDTSYAGMVWHDNRLFVSYYSSHEGKSAIYLAQVKVNADADP